MKKVIALLIFLCFSLSTYQTLAQSRCDLIDSLESILPTLLPSKKRVRVLNRLAENYQTINRKRSYKLAKNAAIMAYKLRYDRGRAESLLNKAFVSFDEKSGIEDVVLEEVSSDLIATVSIYKKLKDRQKQALAYKIHGTLYKKASYLKKKQRLEKARKYLEQSYKLYESLREFEDKYQVASLLAEVYYALEDHDRAFDYAKIASESDESTTAALIKSTFRSRERSQNMILYYLIVGIVIALALVGLLARTILDSRKLNMQLEEQAEELRNQKKIVEDKKKELEDQAQKLQLAYVQVEDKNKQNERLVKEQLLLNEQIEMRYVELSEKNEELKQMTEEVKAQRDNLEKSSKKLQENKKELEAQAQALKKSNETVTILSKIGQSITASLNSEEIFDTVFGYVAQMMPAEGFHIIEYHPEDAQIEYKFIKENEEVKKAKFEDFNQKNPANWVIKNKKPLIINNPLKFEQFDIDVYSVNPSFNSFIYYPMLVDNKVMGVVGVLSTKGSAYKLSDMDILRTLVSYTGIALQNAETFEKLDAAQEQLVESEKMAALGNLVAGVAHEINTPVGICVTASSRLDSKAQGFETLYKDGKMKRKDLSDFLDTVKQGSKIILTNSTRAADLVQSFKKVAVEQSNESKHTFDLKTYFEETIMALKPEFKGKPYTIELNIPEDIEMNSYAGAFSQVLTNLVMNSLIHGFKGRDEGHIQIDAKKERNKVEIIYDENGNGMPEEVVERLYEPFFTTNRDGGGSGLGMNIVFNLVTQKLGGKLNVESELGKGSKFILEVPIEL